MIIPLFARSLRLIVGPLVDGTGDLDESAFAGVMGEGKVDDDGSSVGAGAGVDVVGSSVGVLLGVFDGVLSVVDGDGKGVALSDGGVG